MSKKIESKLDRYAEALQAMENETPTRTLKDMQAWLAEEGVTVDQSTISRFLRDLRQSQLQDRLLAQITNGSNQTREVEKQFGENPPPELETLIKLQRVLILNLSTQANADPKMMKLVATAFMAVMESERLRIKGKQVDLDARKVSLLEKKADAYDRAQAALSEAKNSKGGLTAETLKKIESELKLL